MALIKAANISRNYNGREVLKDVCLEIDRGEVFTFIGPTGAGKTTLIRIMDLLEPPDSGRLLFDGIDVTKRGANQLEARRRMAYVQQRPLVFAMNVHDNVACGLKWRHKRSAVIKQKVEEALELVGMTDFKGRSAKTLSGGETQRVAIARALVTDPEVLFLDEPTANMDPISTAKIEEALARIIGEQRTTVIMTTHNMSQGQRMASRLGVLIDGRLLQTGNAFEIFNQPHYREVAEFVGMDNMWSGVVTERNDGLIIILVNEQPLQVVGEFDTGTQVNVLIRPEEITLAVSLNITSARNTFKGKVVSIGYQGPLVRIHLDCGFPVLSLITRRSAEEMNIAVGSELYASFKATAVRVVKHW
jgi:tungstate transport system ATP-binding protein